VAHLPVAQAPGDPVDVVTIETLGAGLGTLRWGGNIAFSEDAEPYDTSRIAQGGMNFDGFAGMATVSTSTLVGDYNNNGRVEQADLDFVLLDWGNDVTTNPPPPEWTNQRPTDGFIDQQELDDVLLNWGNVAALGNSAAVPEPSAIALALLLVACGVIRLRLHA